MKIILYDYSNKHILLEKNDITLKKTVNIISKLLLMKTKLLDKWISITNIDLLNILKDNFNFSGDYEEIDIKNIKYKLKDIDINNIEESKQDIIYSLNTSNFLNNFENLENLEKEIEKDKNSKIIYEIIFNILKKNIEISRKQHMEEIKAVKKSEEFKIFFS